MLRALGPDLNQTLQLNPAQLNVDQEQSGLQKCHFVSVHIENLPTNRVFFSGVRILLIGIICLSCGVYRYLVYLAKNWMQIPA
jgi:hypothetical protein